jgi:hypothetical protein
MKILRRLSAMTLLAVAFAACGSTARTPEPSPTAVPSSAEPSLSPLSSSSTAPSASPNPADLAVYAQIESQVQTLRDLPARTTVTPELLDSQGVREWLTKANAAQTNHQALADESRLFIHLGLLPAGSSLEQMELDLQAEQVIGFYDPASKGLYVLSESGGVGAVEKITFSHEYTHALQDQNFGLDKLAIDTPDQGDRDLARTALPEGDATMVMTQWSVKYMSLADLIQIAGSSIGGAQTDQLASAPAILRETLLFPYEDGLNFVQGIYQKGGWAAVDRLYSNPPASTSQILHPDLYTTGVEPVAISVPPAPSTSTGWKLTMQDTLGELQLRIWLEGDGSAGATNSQAAAVASWAGDRVGLYEGPDGQWAVVLRTQWRTASGAASFKSAAGKTLAGLKSPSSECGDASSDEIVIASDQTVIPAFSACKSGA